VTSRASARWPEASRASAAVAASRGQTYAQPSRAPAATAPVLREVSAWIVSSERSYIRFAQRGAPAPSAFDAAIHRRPSLTAARRTLAAAAWTGGTIRPSRQSRSSCAARLSLAQRSPPSMLIETEGVPPDVRTVNASDSPDAAVVITTLAPPNIATVRTTFVPGR
jgi:hypothetical protein